MLLGLGIFFVGINCSVMYIWLDHLTWTIEKAYGNEGESEAFLKGNKAEDWENILVWGQYHKLLSLLFSLLSEFSAVCTSGKLSGNTAF